MSDFLNELKSNIMKKAKGTHVSILSKSEIATSTGNIPTPAYDLNRILSGSLFRGIPNRTLTLFVGPEASGKSSFMCLCLAKAQKEGYQTIVIDTEGAWSEGFVSRWGLNPDDILYIYQPWIDKVCVILGQIIDSKQEKIALVIDSIGAMERFKLVEDTAGGDLKADQGALQKESKRMLKMLQYIAKLQNSMVLFSGHYYGKPTTYGGAEDIGGGHYMKLAPDIIVSLKKSKRVGTDKEVIGNDIKAITLKNRYYPPFNECVVEIDYKNGINPYAGLIDMAMEMELVKLGGGWYSFGDKKAHKKENAEKEFLNPSTGLLNKIDEWLSSTGYSTINESIKEQVGDIEYMSMVKEEDKEEVSEEKVNEETVEEEVVEDSVKKPKRITKRK